MTRAVIVDEAAHRFAGGPLLFEGVSARMSGGETWALIGPSGSGKSTLLGMIAGWQQPMTGRIERIGVERVAWVLQNPHGQPHRTAIDHVVFALAATRPLSRADAEREARVVLRRFGIEGLGARPFRSLSGGEAQRLMLARALATRADLLLVDEPTAQLDRASAQTVNVVLAGLASEGAIVVIATHDHDTMAACSHTLDLSRASSAVAAVSR